MKKFITVAVILSTLILTGCATTLSGIKGDPARYAGEDVRISTTVALEIPLPFLDYSLYQIKDKTDRMFLFTDKKYRISDRINETVHVIGISDGKSISAFEEIAQQTADFLVKNRMESPDKARALSQKLVRLVTVLGQEAEGCYLLISR